ncbi:hypothetical protein O7543_28125 [Solwaraspora sp. WMMA2080]|uniref:hypothetical protein n=1 Tax=unclassified Solwaraspora TaxID=2627926 RepID=UPI00248BE48D|nr:MULTISPECIES: hypothetical protein [unclassified Solwaraspora]WBB95505.1 hypothetical protein O7553_19240 [Solwaraspora sp. WMMA2059]WBC20590.1 hypothetical protein O7543_28125 [Solwaraspora sp. WMMA2080]
MSEDRIVDALTVLTAGPTPYGQELATAERLAGWGASRWPELAWRVDRLPATAEMPRSANLVVTAGRDVTAGHNVTAGCGDAPELLICSHLDTSLTGEPGFDEPITGVSGPTGGLRRSAGPAGDALVDGFGLGVARAAAATALVGFVAAAEALRAADRPHRLTLLLAATGTHRYHLSQPPETPARVVRQQPGGVARHLDRYPPPAAAVLAKSSPPGVLTAEPGALYLRVRLTGRFHPVLARERAVPPGGLITHLGVVIEALEAFRRRHLAARADPTAAVGAEVGIGAVRAGQPAKPDLLPGRLDLHLYLVTVPGDDPARIRDEVQAAVTAATAGTPLAECPVSVDGQLVHPAAATAPDAPIARHACDAWTAAYGEQAPPVLGWTGSTDGVVLRGRGVPTVRLGPPGRGADPADPRRDRYALADLRMFAGIYADIAVRHTGTIDSAGYRMA